MTASGARDLAPVPVVPPTGGGSLGDDGVVRGVIAALHAQHRNGVVLEQDRPWHRDASGLRTSALAPRRAPIRLRSAVNKAVVAAVASVARDVILPSTDILDGFYGPVEAVARLDAVVKMFSGATRLHFVGFSWERSHRVVIDFLRGLDRATFAARDAASCARFASDTRLPVMHGADLALLVDAVIPPPAPIAEAISGWRAEGRRIVAVTPNGLWHQAYPDLVTRLTETLVHPALEDAAVLLVPHDHRRGQEDAVVAERVISEIDGRLPAGRLAIAQVRSFPASRGVLALADVQLAGRMHAGIAALSVGTPAAFLAFQKKTRGVLADLGVEEAEVPPELLSDAAAAANLLSAMIEGRAAFWPRISGAVSKARRRARVTLLGGSEPVRGCA